MKPRAATCLLFSALAACQVDSAPVSQVSARDSAGIRIVEYGAVPPLAPPFVFSSQPLYRYGAGPEDYPFQSIWRGALFADGSAAVIDALSAEIVLIAPDGTFRGCSRVAETVPVNSIAPAACSPSAETRFSWTTTATHDSPSSAAAPSHARSIRVLSTGVCGCWGLIRPGAC